VEGTGSYGAGLTRSLRAAGIAVVEINRPHAHTRARRGKTYAIDAEGAAVPHRTQDRVQLAAADLNPAIGGPGCPADGPKRSSISSLGSWLTWPDRPE